jgi:hypothetical protein
MVLTALFLRLLKAIDGTRHNWLPFSSIVFGALVLGLPLLAGCAPEGNSGTDAALARATHGGGRNLSTITLSPTKLDFSAAQGGSDPAGQAVDISNSGRGRMDWSVSTTAPWLALSPVTGKAPSSFNATAIIAGLAAGTYSTTITVTGVGATNTPQSIPVTLTISTATSATPTSTISLSRASLAFSAAQGGSNPAGQAVAISNSGSGTLNWSVSTTAPWLALSPVTGTAPSSFNAHADISGLAAGTYSTTITVTGVGATNTPQSIPVTLTISAATSTTLTTTSTITASVSLGWNPVTDPSITGYYVHYGTQSPNSVGSCAYTKSTYYSLASLASASSPAITISDLASGTTYYFSVSAYNGLESACSNEVSTNIPSV